MGKIIANTSTLSKAYIGTNEVKKIYLGNVLLYQSQQQLPTPSISLWNTSLYITNTSSFPSGTRYNIYVDGVYKTYTTSYYAEISYYISTVGTHAITVIATKSGYADSNVSNTVYYTYAVTLSDPELYVDSDAIPDVRVTNNNDVEVTCYYGSYSGSTDYSVTISANSSEWVSNGIEFDETYYFHFEASGYSDSGESSIYVSQGGGGIEPPSVVSSGSGGYAEISNPNDFSVELYIDGAYYGDMSAYDYQVIHTGGGYISFQFWGDGQWSSTEQVWIDY